MGDLHQNPKILMLLTNPFQPDPRVLNGARTLKSAYDVTIWALTIDTPQARSFLPWRLARQLSLQISVKAAASSRSGRARL